MTEHLVVWAPALAFIAVVAWWTRDELWDLVCKAAHSLAGAGRWFTSVPEPDPIDTPVDTRRWR